MLFCYHAIGPKRENLPHTPVPGKPLPVLLLEATAQDAVPESLAPLYEKARAVLAAGGELEESIRKRRRRTA